VKSSKEDSEFKSSRSRHRGYDTPQYSEHAPQKRNRIQQKAPQDVLSKPQGSNEYQQSEARKPPTDPPRYVGRPSGPYAAQRRQPPTEDRREHRAPIRDLRPTQEERPAPINGMCVPSCPLFECAKRALVVRLVDGKPTPWCTWVDGPCIGYKCQYASCRLRYLLPDGRCLAPLKERSEGKMDEFEAELSKQARQPQNLKNLMLKRGLKKDFMEELF